MHREKREYRSGDQIHILVTPDFAPKATEFIKYCKKNNINVSGVIRELITKWIEEKKREENIIKTSYVTRKKEKKIAERYEKSVLFEEE